MSEQAGSISNGVTFIAIWVYVCALALVLLTVLAVMTRRADTNERNGNVGRSVGYAVGEHHQYVTHITTDPAWNPVIPATPGP